MATNSSKYKLTGVNGSEIQISLNGPTGPTGPANVLEIGTVTTVESNVPAAANITGSSPTQTLNLTLPKGNTGPNTVTTSTTTNLTGYIFGNGTNVAGATAASSAGNANTLVLRSATGSAEFNAGDEGEAAVTGYSNGNGGVGLLGIDFTNTSSGVYGQGNYGVQGFGEGELGIGVHGQGSSYGVSGSSNDGIGVIGTSFNGTGGKTSTFGGTYQHEFGGAGTLPDANNNRLKIERIRCWLVWFFSTFTGRLKTADITANREWTLPDESGTIALARNTSRTIYVDTNGTDTRGSLSKYNLSVPFATIGAAMAASVIGDTVRVRAGNYTITQTIILNGEGYLHLEEGAVVTCSVTAGGPVFSLTANESKSISGGGQFIITGNTTTFWQQSGGGLQTQLCSVECATINTTTSPLNAATIFDVSTGVLVVNAETVYALGSTIIYCAGTSSNLHYAVKFTYCSRFAHFPTSGSSAQMSCDCWTIACYGTKCFQIVGGTVGAKYETLIDNFGNGTLFSLEYGNDSTTNALVIKGGRAITYSNNPCIRFTTTTGANKFVRLIGDPFFHTGGDNSITAASARTVLSSFASSNKPVGTGVSITGTYSVDAGFTQ